MAERVERSLALCTALVFESGYDRAAGIAKAAQELSGLDKPNLNCVLEPRRQIKAGEAQW